MIAIGVLLAAAVVLVGITAGVVLLIVGLTKRRPELWGTGLAVGVVSLLLMVAALGVFVRKAFHRTAYTMTPPAPMAVTSGPRGFTFVTGLSEQFIYDGSTVTIDYEADGTERVPIPYEGLHGLDAVLDAHFTKAAWDDVKDDLALPQGTSDPDWRPEDFKDKRLCRRTRPDAQSGGTWRCVVAHDPAAGTALVAARRSLEIDDLVAPTTGPGARPAPPVED